MNQHDKARAARFRRYYHSREYMAFIRDSTCACGCGMSLCEVAHDPYTVLGGTWKDTYPLYKHCHMRMRRQGSKNFWEGRHQTREEAVRRTQEAWEQRNR